MADRAFEVGFGELTITTDSGAANVVSAEDISGGGTIAATLAAAGVTDWPRSVDYVATDASGTDLVAVVTTVGIDQFGNAATETATLNTGNSWDVEGTQIFLRIDTVTMVITNGFLLFW